MPKELVISATAHETRVAILEDGQLCEVYIEREKEFALVGSIYKGRVTRVLPGMQSAFVDIGLDSDAFLYVSDFLENLEEYDQIVTTVEGKVQKMEQQGGEVFAPAVGGQVLEPPEVSPTSGPESGPPGESAAAGSAARTAPAHSATPPPAPSYERRERGPAGYGRDREGRGGWGRRGGRGGQRQGRDLPPSKYAPGRPYEPRSYPPRGTEPPRVAEEPILLPGESLAKYKARIPVVPAVPAAPATETRALPETFPLQPEPAAPPLESSAEARPEKFEGQLPGSLPKSLYVAEVPSPPVEAESMAPEAAALPTEEFSAARAEAELTEDEVTALAEQLAEAKHEEAQAVAEE